MRIYTQGRRVSLGGRYSVDEDGVVWSGELPLEAIGGIGVNIGGRRLKIAELVAEAFLMPEEGKPYVRHKNGDVKDNRLANLEWSDRKEEKERGRKPMQRMVRAWDCLGKPVGQWMSVREAAEATGAKAEAIRACLYGKQKYAGGLLWQ